MVQGEMGIFEPAARSPEVEPTLLFVPLAAFDRCGHRLGYGAGHYDCTLSWLRIRSPIIAVGVGFACQEVAAIPAGSPRSAARFRDDGDRSDRLPGCWKRPVMRLLFIGDIVGRCGRAALLEHLPDLRRRWALDFVVVNGENAAGGFGITETICDEFLAAGADCVTLGNHAWDQKEALVFIERQPRLVRPLNYPPGTPGRGANLFEAKNGARVLVMNVLGRVFMDALDDPFAAVERELAACALGTGCDAIVIDVHAETTSEKYALGHFVDGRASLVVGTHTHVPTADHQIFPHGTAFHRRCRE